MYSRLDAIFRTQPRHAESADARLAIREHEDRQDRKKDEGPRDNDSSFWEDSTSVSVTALLGFLENLIAGGGPSAAGVQADIAAPEGPPPMSPSPASQAAKAYQRTYNAAYPEEAVETGPAPDFSGGAERVELNAEEQRIVHRLIENLKILAGNGITSLALHLGDRSFLDSLIEAVKNATEGEAPGNG
jgi:hypothetical protein